VSVDELDASLFVHEMLFAEDDWNGYTQSDEFTHILRERMRVIGLSPFESTLFFVRRSIGTDPAKRTALDLAVRGVAPGATDPAAEALRLFDCAYDHACAGGPAPPAEAWTARPATPGPKGERRVRLRGAVLIKIRGRRSAPPVH
jgi:hypothetical protein